jgi:hypothetical protein
MSSRRKDGEYLDKQFKKKTSLTCGDWRNKIGLYPDDEIKGASQIWLFSSFSQIPACIGTIVF